MVCRASACAFAVGVEAVHVQWTLLSHSLGRFLLAMTKSFCFFLLIKENGLLSNECLYHTEIKSLTLPSWKCLSSRREREREKGKETEFIFSCAICSVSIVQFLVRVLFFCFYFVVIINTSR